METPLISIIVPVYKVEQYLEQCVVSLINQTYTNLEIILVDDGSPDNCPKLCDEFAEQDSRIRVIHKENGGLSDARNAGTELSTGRYIAFVDSDDWVHCEYIKTLYEAAEENNADIVVCNNKPCTDSGFKDKSLTDIAAETFRGEEAVSTLLYQRKFETSAHGKLYKEWIPKKFLYPRGRLYEDLFTTYKMLFATEKVVYVPEKLYYYRQNPTGIMNLKFTPKMFDELDAANEIVDFVQRKCPQLLPAAYARKFSSYSQVLRWTKKADRTPEILKRQEEIWAFLKQYRWKMMLDKNARAKNRIAALLTLLGIKAYIRL